MPRKTKFIKSSGNVFLDLGFDSITAKKFKFRSDLMMMLLRYIQNQKLTQAQAAKRLGVSQPRISNLMHCKIDLFSTDMLFDMLERIGIPFYTDIKKHTEHLFNKHLAKINAYH